MSRLAALCPPIAPALLASAIGTGLFAAPRTVAAQDILGRLGDPASWRSDEFTAQWGLGAIGAEYAYARGLTGQGIRVGVFDSGTALEHPEFAGKDNRNVTRSVPYADGSPCLANGVISGPGACFRTEGNEPVLQYSQLAEGVSASDRAILAERGIPGISYDAHGTQVAGIVSANRNGSGLHGVAFGASVSVARTRPDSVNEHACADGDTCVRSLTQLENDPSITTPQLGNQLQSQGVRILNNSWGISNALEPRTEENLRAGLADPELAPLWEIYATMAIRNGVVQVFAAGNIDPDTNGDGVPEITTPAQAPVASFYPSIPIAQPQAEPYWLSVVSVGQDRVLNNFSMRCGPSARWCIAAPGQAIQSTALANTGNLSASLQTRDDGSVALVTRSTGAPLYGYSTADGTSFSAPHVAGALALLQQRYPYLSISQVRDVLLTTATDLGAPGVDDVYGWGLVNLRRAIDGPGQLLVINGRRDSEVVLDRPAGGARTWEGPAWDDWKNDIGGEGRLVKSGSGWLRLSGDNRFGGLRVREGTLELAGRNRYASQVDGGTLIIGPQGSLSGETRVNAGRLHVEGRVASPQLQVERAGLLSGTGRVEGTLTVKGTLAPGNSIGTLHVQGDYIQAAGSRYVAEVDASGAADRLDVSGVARLGGGVLAVQAAPGRYTLGQRFNVLRAEGGLSGQFAAVEQTALSSPLLAFALRYGATQANLDVVRGRSLASYARTRNERATAAAADGLPIDQGIPVPLTQLQPNQALAALRQLGGETHPGLRTITVEQSRFAREASLARTRAEIGLLGEAAPASGPWVQFGRANGTLAGNGNAGSLGYSGNMALAGYDVRSASGWLAGLLVGSGKSYANNDLRDRGRIRSTVAGAYAGKRWGGFELGAGYAQAREDYRLGRTIDFAGFSDQVAAHYQGRTRQAFVEAAYRFGGKAWELQPFAQYAAIRAESEGFRESGGAAALTAASGRQDVGATLAGLRMALHLRGAQQAEPWLSLRGSIARRFASGDLTPVTQASWRGGSDYTIAGVPLARQSLVYEAGVVARLSPRSRLEFNYSRQSGGGIKNEGLFARYSVGF